MGGYIKRFVFQVYQPNRTAVSSVPPAPDFRPFSFG
jgi:hypothetical protein